jgi:hypothetical protein
MSPSGSVVHMPSIKWLLTLLVVAGGYIFYNYGTLSPCAMFRAELRRQAAHEGSFGGDVAAILPDSALDALIEAQYGQLTPGRCVGFLLAGDSTNPQPRVVTAPLQPVQPLHDHSPQDARMQSVLKRMAAITKECRDKRVSGGLKSYVESTNCSNPRIVQAFQQATTVIWI